MAETRYRARVFGLNNEQNPNDNPPPIHLGQFRDKLIVYHNGVQVDAGWGDPYNVQSYVPQFYWKSIEKTWDELHSRARSSNSSRSWYNTGGPFLHTIIESEIPIGGVAGQGIRFNAAGTKKFEGGFMSPLDAYWPSGWWSNGTSSIWSTTDNQYLPDVSAYFDRLWRMAKPKLEFASLYVFLREIGDTVPMLETSSRALGLAWKDSVQVEKHFNTVTIHGAPLGFQKMEPKELAENYINQEFGWNPFLGDLKSFFETYLDASKIIKKINDENGKWVRKKVKLPLRRTETVLLDQALDYNSTSYSLPCYPVNFPSEFFQAPPSWTVTEVNETSISASGKFRFYRPEFDVTLPDYSSAWNQVMRAIKIYGLEVNPYHIWQATPWTWLVDWVTNIGSYIQRFSDDLEDEVAAAYFFITARCTVERIFTIKLPFYSGLETLQFKRRFISHQRVSADSPYGFSLSWDNLTPRRLAILAALGITRKNYHGR